MHLIFSNLRVTQKEAQIMALAIIAEFGFKAPKYFAGKKVEDVIDSAVYKSNGLRMIGSYKAKKCSDCNRRTHCDTCKGLGKYDAGKIYGVRLLLGSNMANLQIPQNDHRVIRLVSIRTFDQPVTSGWATYCGCPTIAPKVPRQSKKSIHFDADDPVYVACQNAIRASHHKYARLNVTHVKFDARKSEYMIRVAGENQSFCQNRTGGYHNSNSIYFVINPSGGYQRCFSNKTGTENRLSGVSCQHFKKMFVIVDTCKQVLFQSSEPKTARFYTSDFDGLSTTDANSFRERLGRVLDFSLQTIHERLNEDVADVGKKQGRGKRKLGPKIRDRRRTKKTLD